MENNILVMWDARNRSRKMNNVEWFDTWTDRITDLLMEKLPHGSGIDCDWVIHLDNASYFIVCTNSYHVMNENGMYNGFIDFRVVIILGRRDIFGNLIIDIKGKFGKYQDIKDYLQELITTSFEGM